MAAERPGTDRSSFAPGGAERALHGDIQAAGGDEVSH